MDIPIEAEVRCTDGVAGRCIYVLIHPLHQRLTHLVVKQRRAPHDEVIVPLARVTATTPDLISLNCTLDELAAMDGFVVNDFIHEAWLKVSYALAQYVVSPYAAWERVEGVTLEGPHPQIPADEVAVLHGARVEATDRRVGQIDEFVVEPDGGSITHLLLRQGHWWRQKEVAIPIAQIERIEGEVVHLKIDRQAVAALPTIPIHHWWR